MPIARSKSGCLTCRTKKVKCDEQTPLCRRCARLDLPCEWTRSSKRRRRDRPALPSILPKVVVDFQSGFDISRTWPALDVCPLEPGYGILGDEVFEASECHGFDIMVDWLPQLGASSAFGMELDNIAQETSTPASAVDTTSVPQANGPTRMNTAAIPLSLGPLWHNIVLSHAFSQTGREAEALHYYSNIYPTMTVSKNIYWTTFKIVLVKNSQDALTMHLLLAASLIDLAAVKSYDESICRAARAHAKAGMLLLKEALDADASDPVSVMTASFFLYRYWALVKACDALHMDEWSRHVCNYLTRNNLDDLYRPDAKAARSRTGPHEGMTQQTRAHLARVILWTFYEDVFAGISGHGGFLARRMSEDPGRARDVHQHSTAELECFWGNEYPEREILDDVENAPIINFLHQVMTLYAEVNEVAFALHRSAASVVAVQRKIDNLEACSAALFRLTTMTSQPRSRVMINAEYMVPYFYALRIYSYRCFLQHDSSEKAPASIHSCVMSIVQLAQRCLANGPAESARSRFQWSLFMAGIETTDNVYKEWIHSKFKSARLSAAFQTILSTQEREGRKISMARLSQILNGRSSS